MGISMIQQIITEVAEAIWEELMPEYLRPPLINQGFEHKWQFPHCCGSLDGKHCIIQCPAKSGSAYWNYKKSFFCCPNGTGKQQLQVYMVDIGACGIKGDSNTFQNSAFGQQFMQGHIPFLNPQNLPGTNLLSPFVIIGDKAFPSLINLVKPYPR